MGQRDSTLRMPMRDPAPIAGTKTASLACEDMRVSSKTGAQALSVHLVTIVLWRSQFHQHNGLPNKSVHHLIETGFVIIPGRRSGEQLAELTAA